MSKLKLLNYNYNAVLILLASYLLLITEVEISENLFFLSLLIFAIIQKSFNYRYKKIISSVLALSAIYILFVLNDQTLSKEYFINLILALVFLKYSEIEEKKHHYFFNFSCVFLAVSSLIYGQDLLSSLLSFVIVILSIIHLYSLNQKKILKINIKNLVKYLLFAASIIPIIAIVYFVFPRVELNIKLFETKKNQLGIPDKISLGSFQDISDSDDDVFIFTNVNEEIDQKYYFRVKIFDNLNSNKDWLNTDYKILLSKFKNNFKVINSDRNNDVDASIVMFPHQKNWIPKLSNYYFNNQNLNLNLINDTITTNKVLSNKKSFKLVYDKREILYQREMLDYYTLLPENISIKLKEWAQTNFSKSSSKQDYLDKILYEFNTNNFFYSLTPAAKGNDYENFFFTTKTGYCEYYAGTFAILARLVGIPARIVTGYFGGSRNELGDFYTFKQQDAHSWVEVFINGKWTLYDPTLSVPNENILNSNNDNFDNLSVSTNETTNTQELTINKIGIYLEYINYVWTNSFLSYDEQSRTNFIKDYLSNSRNYKFMIIIGLGILSLIYFTKIILFFYSRNFLYALFFYKLKKKNKDIKSYMTHQEIFNVLNKSDQLRFKNLFNFYEKNKFGSNYKISFSNFYDINLQILKYAYFK